MVPDALAAFFNPSGEGDPSDIVIENQNL